MRRTLRPLNLRVVEIHLDILVLSLGTVRENRSHLTHDHPIPNLGPLPHMTASTSYYSSERHSIVFINPQATRHRRRMRMTQKGVATGVFDREAEWPE